MDAINAPFPPGWAVDVLKRARQLEHEAQQQGIRSPAAYFTTARRRQVEANEQDSAGYAARQPWRSTRGAKDWGSRGRAVSWLPPEQTGR